MLGFTVRGRKLTPRSLASDRIGACPRARRIVLQPFSGAFTEKATNPGEVPAVTGYLSTLRLGLLAELITVEWADRPTGRRELLF